MAKQSWTTPQQNAIEARGGTLLVSAAAGSGKTAVLVERAIGLLCDKNSPVPADRLLIVTFSNAAAAEMKQRIGARLSAMIRENPGDLHLQRQQALLAGAQISTIHSFCLELIRRNFQNLEISPDFSIADPNELDILRSDCARDAVEAFYEQDETGEFAGLVELLSSGRDDSRLLEVILRIHEFSRSHPFYESWLDEKLAMYDPDIPVGETVWGQAVLRYGKNSLEYCLQTHRAARELLYGDERLEKAYLPAFEADLAQIERCLAHVAALDWDRAVEALGHFEFVGLGPVKGTDSAKVRAKAVRDRNKKIIQELGGKYFSATGAQFRDDIADLRPKINVLFDLVLEFDARLQKAKEEKKRLDFSDLEHLALRLLVKKEENGYRQTGQAEEIALGYDYIMVDEYQDTNEVQDLIFRSVSRREENLFMVGDVKQSIYSFRQAMPEIFMEKKERFAPYDGAVFPATVLLDTNFRSRRQVTEGVNYLFERLMSREMGEIDYNEEESLKCGARFAPYEGCAPELLVVDTSEEEGPDRVAEEAGAIARRIRKMLEGEYLVREGEGLRPARFRDFCILLRSPRGRAEDYVKELARYGIPAWADNANGYLEAREVAAVVALLKALDNPLLDIELAAAMLSPLFDFTDDDLGAIRLYNRRESLYLALTAAGEAAGHLGEKVRAFLALFRRLRTLGAVLPADRLLLRLYEATDALGVVRAMPMGEGRVANLLLLMEYAASYHRMGYKRLSGFVGFLQRLQERGGDLSPANTLGEGANVVRIMSVHRSKGLQFPVVFLADCAKTFNKMDLRQNTLLHSRFGFACVRRDPELLKQYPTVPMQAIRLEQERSMLSEELRILYVALTRAEEKLIVTCAWKGSPGKKLAGLAGELPGGKLPPYIVGEAGCYGDWIAMALLHHPSGAPLREAAGVDDLELLDDGNPWQVSFARPGQEQAEEQPEKKAGTAVPDPALLKEIDRRVSFVYPHLAQTVIPTKLAVSEVAKGRRDVAYRFAARPKFLMGAGLTAAEKGNALHKFMQFADYEAARDSLDDEIRRMEQQQYLTAAEVKSLRKGKLRQFFASPLAKRMFASTAVHRELKFTAECGRELLGGYLEGMDSESRVVLQGVADCVFVEQGGAVIVDYKTDHVKTGQELYERYAKQLELYRAILEQSLGQPVKECVLYSFGLSREVRVYPEPVEREDQLRLF